MTDSNTNPMGMRGIAFMEYATIDPAHMADLFFAFGFSRLRQHKTQAIEYFNQHGINFLVNSEPNTFAASFQSQHGPSVCGMGIRFEDPRAAYNLAVERGARPFVPAEGAGISYDVPAVYGVGDMAVYFVGDDSLDHEFVQHDDVKLVKDLGFLNIDHLTNNVVKGTLQQWWDFYKDVFDFSDVRTFDIQGAKTGLYSSALRSPCGTFCLPINESTDEKSQIAEYIREYNGPGVQHIAFLSENLLDSLDAMGSTQVDFLDIDDEYYDTVYDRVPNVTEDKGRIKTHQVLVDGDEDGYLLQIFTRNLVGPVFIELIQRKNHWSFGEGNFGALFRSIERDQERRGVI